MVVELSEHPKIQKTSLKKPAKWYIGIYLLSIILRTILMTLFCVMIFTNAQFHSTEAGLLTFHSTKPEFRLWEDSSPTCSMLENCQCAWWASWHLLVQSQQQKHRKDVNLLLTLREQMLAGEGLRQSSLLEKGLRHFGYSIFHKTNS